jgi:hypothetical protein
MQVEPKAIFEFKQTIENMMSFLKKYTTTNIHEVAQHETEYQTLKSQLSKYFTTLSIPDPNGFPSLEKFSEFCKLQYHHWNERRDYIKNMYGSTLQALNDNLKQGGAIKITSLEPNSFVCKPVFTGRNIKVEPLCFVLMPFKPNFQRIYEEIKPVIEKFGFEVKKANDLYTVKPVIEDIWEYINKASVIVADVTGKNPNVFYELGIAHTIGKRTIIITQNEEDVPFDLKYLRYFKYQDDTTGWKNLKDCLENILSN